VGRIGMSIMSEHFSWHTALLTISVIDLVVAVAFVLLLPQSRNFVRSTQLNPRHHFTLWQKHMSHPGLPLLFLIGCCAMGVFVTIYNYTGFRLMAAPFNLSQTETGLIFSAYVFGIVSSSVAGALSDRVGRGSVLVGGVAITALGLLLACQSSLVAIVLGIVVLTIGFFVTHSVASGWVGRMANGAKGHASSLYLLAYYAGSSVLGSAGGWFWENDGWTSVGYFSFALLALCFSVAVALWWYGSSMEPARSPS
jgi:YNFM family putative membrane transporter